MLRVKELRQRSALRNKHLRSGYTTGACAAAAAKAATALLLSSELRLSAHCRGVRSSKKIETVEIPFPDGSRVNFRIQDSGLSIQDNSAWATVIKDAGDDPDVTNGAEIKAEARMRNAECEVRSKENNDLGKNSSPIIKGGKGVGVVTKPGLPLPVGEAAINPVPRKMISEAVLEAINTITPSAFSLKPSALEVTISVPEGERLAKKTLNSRLGIIGGISILGTTGIVRPLSTEAWTASITSAMDVAKALGHNDIVLSSGRASEEAHMKRYKLPVESYIMMGDYLEFSLEDARKHKFRKIHLCAQWAKMLKIGMLTPQTHVRHGAISIKKAVELLQKLGIEIPGNKEFNTAREIFDLINSTFQDPKPAFIKVCAAAKKYAGEIAKEVPVTAYLVSYEGEIIASDS